MKKNNLPVMLTSMFVLLSSGLFTISSSEAQVPCYNVCQKTIIDRDCWGTSAQSVEFIYITCEGQCPNEEHIRTECPCTWEMWVKINETDCDGKSTYIEQKVDDFPCGTNPKPDEHYTWPCVTPYGQSDYKKRSASYEIRRNNCECESYHDVYYQYIDMGCHSHKCKKTVTREFCDGSIIEDPPEYIEVPCPGNVSCPPDSVVTDTVCHYECGVTTTYYDCDDPETIDYVEPMQTVTYTYNCIHHDMPVCPPHEEFFEDCDDLITDKELRPYKIQRRVVRDYELLWKDCSKAVRTSTVYEMVE
jgi:hypothetical protein